ncbi:hypothetical protein [Streptomyces lavendulocolor]|uniref:hypothetical protein n=1 Tax=Streptomyces lavendulocolor TaxID=67316 RepID=UPI003C2FDA05
MPARATSPRPAARPRRPPLQAQEAGFTEDRFRQIATEALGEVYFRDSGCRARGLEVELTDLLDLDFEL